MKPWLKISLTLFGLLVLSFAVAPFIPKHSKEITSGLIDSVWMVPAYLDKRLHSPGVWEQAWLDTSYWMRLQDVNTRKFRTVELHKVAYDIYKDQHLTFVELGDREKFEKDSLRAVMETTRTRVIDSLNREKLRIALEKAYQQ